ncbi:MAG: hypothetical protein LBR13_03720 [Dysgonamonadaceae bacterium]|jgi:predicted O-methyltransferase YrrM|nr:hypothetical protein [Dysgonamonadaceae bacterium]
MKIPKPVKIYRKLLYRKGYGVHSPFIFNLITKVIEEKSPYYFYEDIENFRNDLVAKKNKISIFTKREAKNSKYGALISRLVNFFKCNSVIQLGGSTGIVSLYAAFPLKSSCRCYILEERRGMMDAAKSFAEAAGLQNYTVMEGNYSEKIEKIKTENQFFDLIFLNHFGDADKTANSLQLIEPLICEKTVLVIDNISGNQKMLDLWERIKRSPKTGVTIDLYALGIVLFNDKLNKSHYKCYFDYGKKQNLYKKRRRGFHFFSRRKKSAENQPQN